MKKNLLLLMLLFFLGASGSYAADYYWVNGAGNWSDINHWRIGSSTGALPSIVPSQMDNVFFDENSGFGTTDGQRTVTLNANGFCHSMSWSGAQNAPIFIRSNASYTIEIWGDLDLSPDVRYDQQFIFKGATENDLSTHGAINGVLGLEINKPGGKLTLTDSLVNLSTNRSNNIVLTAGILDISDKKVIYVQLNSNNANERTLVMTGASVNLSYRWDLRGANKALQADASELYTGVYLFTDDGLYDKVQCNGKDYNNFGVFNTSFSRLQFTNPNSASYAQINDNNIVDSLIFNGTGRIFNSNTVQYIQFEQAGRIMGENNVLHLVKNMGNFSVEEAPVSFDSLLLAPNKSASFVGAVTVNQYLEAKGLPCDAFTELTGDTTTFLLTFGAAATADIDNVYLTGIRAQGPIIPLTVTGIDGDGNQGFVVNPPASSGASTYYWVGGAGDWNDKSHWSLVSGGSGGACIPFINDDVVFDANSGLVSGSNTITTTGNVYCHDMVWASGVGTAIFEESDKQKCLIYGSVELNPSVIMDATLEFTGNQEAALTVNASTEGNLTLWVKKEDGSALTLKDDWSNEKGIINLQLGYLNMPDRKVDIYSFISTPNYAVRHLDITNADIHVRHTWAYIGVYKYMESAGSVVTADYEFQVNGLTYPNVNLTYGGSNNAFNIRSTTFGSLVFSATSATSNAYIGSGNTIRKLEFAGAGRITGNTNTIDSLLLASSRNYAFTGTTTVNDYLNAVSASCTGLSELRGAPSGTIAFGTDAEINMNNIYMMNMTATGATPSFTGADAGGNTGWTITSAAGGERYWVGGAGDWNDASHWSLISGGPSGACVPTIFDDVYFDAASGFTADSKTVTINNGNAYCRNLDWTGAPNSPVWNMAAAWTIEAWGTDIVLNPEATFNISPLVAKGATATVLSGTVLGDFDLKVDKEGGSLRLANDYSNHLTDILLSNGQLDASGRTISVASMDNSSLNEAMQLDISNSTVTATKLWCFAGDSTLHVLNAEGSVINTAAFTATAGRYPVVTVSGVKNTDAVLTGTTVQQLTFSNASSVSKIGLNGASNKIGTLNYKGGGGVYGTGNIIDTLIFFPGGSYVFTEGTSTTIVDEWYGSGTPCKLTEIATAGTENATINKTNGSASFDYIRLKGITAIAATPFLAAEHTIDQGGNNGWDISPYNGAMPLKGLGEDRAIPAAQFPYTITTEGFFGTPLAKYTWGDGSQLDSLVISDTGYYRVQVRFEDGCTVDDTVHITFDTPLPVGLADFNVKLENCAPVLHWRIVDADHFSRFVVERSDNGNNFEKMAEIRTSAVELDYTYNDHAVKKNGNYYYRLKLVDGEQHFEYSDVKSTKVACAVGQIRLYPNPTSGIANLNLSGHQHVRIMVVNPAGQKIRANVSNTNNQYQVDLTQVSSGIYFIKVVTETTQQTFKVIKQ